MSWEVYLQKPTGDTDLGSQEGVSVLRRAALAVPAEPTRGQGPQDPQDGSRQGTQRPQRSACPAFIQSATQESLCMPRNGALLAEFVLENESVTSTHNGSIPVFILLNIFNLSF